MAQVHSERRDTVLTVGMAYRDVILTGLRELPRLGEERYGTAIYEMWGGIATMARVCSALGMPTALATAVGDDEASGRLLGDMRAAGIDTALVKRHPGWRLPVTVALATPEDRAMVTVEETPPLPLAAHLDEVRVTADAIVVDLRDPAMEWLRRARADGARVYASRGFDPSREWDEASLAGADTCDVCMLNELEATEFTGESDPLRAARKLSARIPLVVVTRGADGMVGIDSATGEEASVAAFPVVPRNTTGAGDSTLAAFACVNQLSDEPLHVRLSISAFIASVLLGRPEGAVRPPTVAELLQQVRTSADARAGEVESFLSTLR